LSGEVAKQSAPSQAKATGLVSMAIMFSRVLGLVREVVFAALFGANRWTDAFSIAFRTPNMLRDLVAEGALSTAFVTTFSKKIKEEGDGSAWDLARKMATLVAVAMSVIVLLGSWFAPLIIRVLMPDWDAEQVGFTAKLARIMYPFIALVSLAALVMGMLNAKGRFFIPALASSFFNIGSIVAGTVLGYYFDPEFGPGALTGFAIGTLVGGLCQLVVQVPSLFRVGFRFKPDFRFRDPGVRKVLSLMWPAMIAGSAVQINVLLNSMFASFLVGGSVSWLEKAFRLMQLPLGVFGVAVGMVTLPAVSKAATKGITPEFGRLLSKGTRLVLLLTLPSAVGLLFLAEPIISIIYERGKFSTSDTDMAAAALRTYSIGLVFYAGIKVVQPAFYAIDRRFVPMVVSFGSIAINAGLNAFFLFVLDYRDLEGGHAYLSLSTSVAAVVNFTVLYAAMNKYGGKLETKALFGNLAKLVVPVVMLGAVCWGAGQTVLVGWDGFPFLKKVLTLLPTIAFAGAVFFGGAILFRIEEAHDFIALLRRRLLRK